MLISFVVTAKLICVFVFACAKSQFSYDANHIKEKYYHEKERYKPLCVGYRHDVSLA